MIHVEVGFKSPRQKHTVSTPESRLVRFFSFIRIVALVEIVLPRVVVVIVPPGRVAVVVARLTRVVNSVDVYRHKLILVGPLSNVSD